MAASESQRCGKYLGDNDGTCPQLTCIRERGHEGLCDNVSDAEEGPDSDDCIPGVYDIGYGLPRK